MSYANSNDMVLRFSANLIGQLLNDHGQGIPQDDLSGNLVLLAALDDAAGEIDSALYVSDRYSNTDLNSLTGQDLNYLARLNCELALVYLIERRGLDTATFPQVARAQAKLEALRLGERVLAIAGNIEAGNTDAEFPSLQEAELTNLAVTNLWKFFNPERLQRVS